MRLRNSHGFWRCSIGKQGYPHKLGMLLLPHRFLPDGTIDLEINRLNKRDDVVQSHHDEFVHRQLRSLSIEEPESLGYAEDDHRLAKKNFGIHPRIPMFRFDYFQHESMDMTTHDTLIYSFSESIKMRIPTYGPPSHTLYDEDG